ncbi:uncharacterized protein LOC131330257 isoform X4 [Rhododendron vialii]|uniref:uncharacterized protein LOC131330255 isoform X4 n=1 Tax=Rhododendron vialii TaxID=182163 RepID=UPI00265E1569|nr:uncharacterized protein LOC131330255 isoform X4 [Rhododendron vialii]XP_058219763.1 uncharacterized protein LOC131330257 isoform X4 [Rhododendron vialii]
METPMLRCGVVGPVTRSRSKAGEALSSLVGKKRKNREVAYSDLKKKYVAKVASVQKKNTTAKVASVQTKKNAKVASVQKKKKAKGVTTNSEEEAVGLTSEQRQEYSHKDFDYPEFYRGPSSDLPIHIILATEFNPDLPANFSRQIKNSAKAMDYYNSRFNSNYVEPFNPLLMTTREVGGGYLDFVVIDTHKSGRHANEMFQAILYTSPGKEPEALMCRPEYMPPGTKKGYRPLKVGW